VFVDDRFDARDLPHVVSSRDPLRWLQWRRAAEVMRRFARL